MNPFTSSSSPPPLSLPFYSPPPLSVSRIQHCSSLSFLLLHFPVASSQRPPHRHHQQHRPPVSHQRPNQDSPRLQLVVSCEELACGDDQNSRPKGSRCCITYSQDSGIHTFPLSVLSQYNPCKRDHGYFGGDMAHSFGQFCHAFSGWADVQAIVTKTAAMIIASHSVVQLG